MQSKADGTQIDLVNDGIFNWCQEEKIDYQGSNALIYSLLCIKAGDYKAPEGARYSENDNHKGTYRLPRYSEVSTLAQNGKWQFGYVTVEDNKQVYGYLVTEPAEGEVAMTIRFPKEITQDDLSKGLFLPCAGSRYDDTKAVRYAGYGGYYFSSILFEDAADYARAITFDNDGVYGDNGENCRCGGFYPSCSS